MNKDYVTCPVCGKRNVRIMRSGQVTVHNRVDRDVSLTTSGGIPGNPALNKFKCPASRQLLKKLLESP